MATANFTTKPPMQVIRLMIDGDFKNKIKYILGKNDGRDCSFA
jgi:hypothetical protein